MRRRLAVAGAAAAFSGWLLLFGSIGSFAAEPDSRVDRLAQLLRNSADDPTRSTQVIELARRQGVTAQLVSKLVKEGRAGKNGADLAAAARVEEEEGHPVRALDLYEESLLLGPMSARGRVRFVELLLRAPWPERAVEVWRSIESSELPAKDRSPLAFRVLAASKASLEDTAAALDVVVRELGPAPAAELADDSGQWLLAAPLWESTANPRRAVGSWLRAGRIADARRVAEESGPAVLDDAAALALARLSGDARFLNRVLGDRQDAVAERLRRELAISLGEVQRDSGSTVENGGASTPPELTVDVKDPPTARDDREQAAFDVVRGVESPSSREELTADGPPRLSVVLALLSLGDRNAARRELARWTLEPDPEDRERWWARVRHLAPEWFDETLPQQLRRLANAEEGIANDWESRIAAALARVEPGSHEEALLLYHRGRLTNSHLDLRRAVALAPDAWVERDLASGRMRERLEGAAGRVLGEPGFPDAIPVPDPPDARLGHSGPHPVRVARGPLPTIEQITILEWNEVSDPPASDPTVSGKWSAGSIGPVTDTLDLVGQGWLFVGRGLAVLRRSDDRELLRIESPTPWTLFDIPTEALELLSPPLRDLIVAIEPVPPPAWLSPFLEGARRRARDPDLTVTSAIPNGLEVLVRVGNHLRLRIGTGPRFRPYDLGGYQKFGDGWLRRGLSDIPWPAPATESVASPASFRRVWQRTVALPDREHPHVLPTGPSPPSRRDIPAGFGPEVARSGADPCVVVTGCGHVLVFIGTDPEPVWIGWHHPPLWGPGGFPRDPSPPPQISFDRGPDRAGPIADSRTPRIFLDPDGVTVVSDHRTRFDRRGVADRTPLAAPEDRFDFELRDLVARGPDYWFVRAPGTRLEGRYRGQEVDAALPHRTGAFDLEVVDDRVFVLGQHDGQLWALSTARGGSDSQPVALPTLDFDTDRSGQRVTAWSRWGTELFILHDRLYRREANGRWSAIIEWPGSDPLQFPFYQQSTPRRHGDVLVIARPWGVVEGWQAVPHP